jgi:hypothetical protein
MRHLDRQKKIILKTLSVCFLTLLVYSLAVYAATAADKYRKMVNCDAHSGTCKQRLNELDVILEISPRPVKAMQDLQFNLTLSGRKQLPTTTPYIDLGMPGMNMGPNRIILKPVGQGMYAGQGIIVRCPSGRRIWQATVTVPDIGAVKFIFDVIY